MKKITGQTLVVSISKIGQRILHDTESGVSVCRGKANPKNGQGLQHINIRLELIVLPTMQNSTFLLIFSKSIGSADLDKFFFILT